MNFSLPTGHFYTDGSRFATARVVSSKVIGGEWQVHDSIRRRRIARQAPPAPTTDPRSADRVVRMTRMNADRSVSSDALYLTR
jgi:hypothetical protein